LREVRFHKRGESIAFNPQRFERGFGDFAQGFLGAGGDN
jgi:hypothetical protein